MCLICSGSAIMLLAGARRCSPMHGHKKRANFLQVQDAENKTRVIFSLSIRECVTYNEWLVSSMRSQVYWGQGLAGRHGLSAGRGKFNSIALSPYVFYFAGDYYVSMHRLGSVARFVVVVKPQGQRFDPGLANCVYRTIFAKNLGSW